MTGAALAEATGIHPTSLSFIERGRQWPSIPQIEAIARVLGARISDLLSNRAA
jgi:transcriptional regulator with XRE-family HTH domain